MQRIVIFVTLAIVAAACDSATGINPRGVEAIRFADGTATTGTAGEPLSGSVAVRVEDASGQPVPEQPVEFRVLSGGGSVAPPGTATDTDGTAQATWTLGPTAGEPQVLVAVAVGRGGVELASDTLHATAAAGSGSMVTAVGSTTVAGTQGSAIADSLAVRVADARGNPVQGVTVRWSTADGGRLEPESSVTDAAGIARSRWLLGDAGNPQTAVATVQDMGSVTFTAAAATPAVRVRIDHPQANALVGDSILVRATTESADEVVSVTASVGGVEAPLANTAPGRWEGTLSVADLPQGTYPLFVSAVNSADGTGSAERTVRLDAPPALRAHLPISGTVARPQVRAAAACADDASSCLGIEFALVNPTTQVLAWENGDTIDRLVSLAAHEGRAVTVRVTAFDSLLQSRTARSALYVESTSRWTEVASAGNALLDISADRILYLDSASSEVRVRARTGGAETVVRTLGTPNVSTPERIGLAILTPAGALVRTNHGGTELRGGTLLPLRPLPENTVVHREGDWLAWRIQPTMYRQNLATGAIDSLTMGAGEPLCEAFDVNARGAVVCQSRRGLERVLPDRELLLPPLTPCCGELGSVALLGDSVLVHRSSQGSDLNTYYEVVLVLPDGTLQTLTSPQRFAPILSRYGWGAYLRNGADGVAQIYTISPGGQIVDRVRPGAGSVRLLAVGPAGEVVYDHGPRRFLLPAGQNAGVDVGASWEEARVLFVSGVPHTLLGRSVFRITP